MNERYGPNADSVQFVIANQVRALTPDRAVFIMAMSGLVDSQEEARHRALAAARTIPGREAAAMRASEDMRQSIWKTIWDSTQDEAWRVAWAAGMCGVGIATYDLIGIGRYTANDYTTLVGPWLTGGFSDLPIRKAS